MKSNPIGIIDSGIGGVSVLKACTEILPNENFIYYADNKSSPYGNKSKFFIQKKVEKIVFHLISEYQIKCLVIACNTASTICANKLREKYNLPIVAIEPPTKCIKGENKKVLIMATKHTIKNKNVKGYLKTNKNAKTLVISSLAKEIDNNLENLDNINNILQKNLKKFEDIDEIIIGCTHYSFIKKQLQKLMPKTKIVSCEIPVAKQLHKVLSKQVLKNEMEIDGYLKIILSEPNLKMESFIYKNYYDQLNNQR